MFAGAVDQLVQQRHRENRTKNATKNGMTSRKIRPVILERRGEQPPGAHEAEEIHQRPVLPIAHPQHADAEDKHVSVESQEIDFAGGEHHSVP